MATASANSNTPFDDILTVLIIVALAIFAVWLVKTLIVPILLYVGIGYGYLWLTNEDINFLSALKWPIKLYNKFMK